MTDLPRYKSHKEVHAMKIGAIEFAHDGSADIAPAAIHVACGNVATDKDYRQKYKGELHGDPEKLGYYVLYEDGYESWSPTKAFEEGYTLVD